MSGRREAVDEVRGQLTREGAGVKLQRIFGFADENLFDPFLLLDHFGSSDPRDYVAGFPWHPHRGIETITYMLEGSAEHSDSMGNKGTISAGDVQWMTAGSGIIHQEMPKPGVDGRTMEGFQLWVNLPRAAKMSPPRYRGFAAGDIPRVTIGHGVEAGVICGALAGVRGPVQEVVREPSYYDLGFTEGTSAELPLAAELTVGLYVYRGEVSVGERLIDAGRAVRLGPGDRVDLRSARGGRAILFSGRPLGEPIAWGGPIVMNTRAELDLAFQELETGTFIKPG